MVRLTDVKKEYANGAKALKYVSFELNSGEFAFLVGPSGSGKSTIIKLLTGEIAPTEGTVSVNGYDVGSLPLRQMPYLRRTIGTIFQDYRLIQKKTVYENVALAMRAVGATNKRIRERTNFVLNLVGLDTKSKATPLELSGGEMQRVAIARALVNDPQLIIADEPTGNLDPPRSLEILMLLKKINELGTTVLVVTHEKSLVDRLSQRVIAIDGGRIIGDGMNGYYNYEED
ncbi:MAG: cell division ATP-binding protein FtsE [Oscillospiraceae bacterium]|jgi:cell division transport system ATP-binding protein|nr:cell division ATP-binding protein FtsE [Oscillospiraceae bacterium]